MAIMRHCANNCGLVRDVSLLRLPHLRRPERRGAACGTGASHADARDVTTAVQERGVLALLVFDVRLRLLTMSDHDDASDTTTLNDYSLGPVPYLALASGERVEDLRTKLFSRLRDLHVLAGDLFGEDVPLVEGQDEPVAVIEGDALEQNAGERDAVEQDAGERDAHEQDALEQDAHEEDAGERDALEPDALERDAVEDDTVEWDDRAVRAVAAVSRAVSRAVRAEQRAVRAWERAVRAELRAIRAEQRALRAEAIARDANLRTKRARAWALVVGVVVALWIAICDGGL
jgi:hypothetical protein